MCLGSCNWIQQRFSGNCDQTCCWRVRSSLGNCICSSWFDQKVSYSHEALLYCLSKLLMYVVNLVPAKWSPREFVNHAALWDRLDSYPCILRNKVLGKNYFIRLIIITITKCKILIYVKSLKKNITWFWRIALMLQVYCLRGVTKQRRKLTNHCVQRNGARSHSC